MMIVRSAPSLTVFVPGWDLHKARIILSPLFVKRPSLRSGWADAAKLMRERGEDRLIGGVTPTRFDDEEWEW